MPHFKKFQEWLNKWQSRLKWIKEWHGLLKWLLPLAVTQVALLATYWRATDISMSVNIRLQLLEVSGLIFCVGMLVYLSLKKDTLNMSLRAQIPSLVVPNTNAYVMLWRMSQSSPLPYAPPMNEPFFGMDSDDIADALDGLIKMGYVEQEADMASLSLTGRYQMTRAGRQFLKADNPRTSVVSKAKKRRN